MQPSQNSRLKLEFFDQLRRGFLGIALENLCLLGLLRRVELVKVDRRSGGQPGR